MNTDTIIRKQQELIDALMGRDMSEQAPGPVTHKSTATPEALAALRDQHAPGAAVVDADGDEVVPAPAFVFDTGTDEDVTPDVTAGPRFTIVTPEQTSVTLTEPAPEQAPEPAPEPEPAPAPEPARETVQDVSGGDVLVERATTIVTAGSRRKPLTPAETEACVAAWAKARGTTFSKAQAIRECVGLNRVAVMNAIDALEAAGTLTSHVRPGAKRKRYQWA